MTAAGSSSSTLSRALEGIRVVAVEQAVAVPLCTRHLSEMGAEVIKIEAPGRGDFARYFDTYVDGYCSHFVWLNHGKKSIQINLRSEEGLAVLRDLVSSADVFISNLAPGKMESILPVETSRSLNPRLIRCTISGYGSSGPYADRKAYDALVQGEAGATLNTGTDAHPAKSGISLADVGAGTYALAAISAALVQRGRTGHGADLEISLFDVTTEWLMPLLLAQKHTGSVPPPSGMRHASIVPYGAYDVQGGIVNLAVQSEEQWRRLCEDVINRPDLLDDPRTTDNGARCVNRTFVDDEVSDALAELDGDLVQSRLTSANIPWGLVRSTKSVVSHPQLVDRDRWSPVLLPNEHESDVLRPPFLGAGDPLGDRRVPRAGEHTREVLRALGNDDATVEHLAELGAVAQAADAGLRPQVDAGVNR